MNIRGRYLLAAGAWMALVAALLAGLPQIWRHRLPDPMASHWGVSGAPDDAMSIGMILVVALVLWVVLAGGGVVLTMRGEALARRASRAGMGATLASGGVLLLGLEGLTIWANLDRVDWRDAAHVGPPVLLVIVAAAVAGAGGWLLARMGPDAPPTRPAPMLSHPLNPGERAVWVSSLTVPWTIGLASAFAVAAVVLAVLPLELPWPMWTIVPLSAVALAVFTISTIRVQVDDRGLAVAFGPLRWPTRKIPLRRIERAWVEQRQPSSVGGWGYRGLPGAATIMLRGGECLVVRRTSGGELGVSIDDAERGAALLNALVAKHAEHTSQG
jgi:uncharacterized membrane protein